MNGNKASSDLLNGASTTGTGVVDVDVVAGVVVAVVAAGAGVVVFAAAVWVVVVFFDSILSVLLFFFLFLFVVRTNAFKTRENLNEILK